MISLGIHAFTHDASAALSIDGRPVAFAEEERFSRIKGDPEFPYRSIRFCLNTSGVSAKDIDRVTFPFRPERGAWKRLTYLSRNPLTAVSRFLDLWQKGRRMQGIGNRLFSLDIHAPVTHSDHYLAHALAVFLASPFEQAAVMVLDGVAEAWSGAFYRAERFPAPRLTRLGRLPFPHSPGLVYAAVTEHLGFRHNREEGKVMSMAALGDDRYRIDFGSVFQVHGLSLQTERKWFDFGGTWTTPIFRKVFGPPRREGEPLEDRHFALARVLQENVERVSLHMAKTLLDKTGCRDLCFGGGMALNPALNGALRQTSGCGNLYCLPAGGDAGTALGAVLMGKADPHWFLEHPYLGYEASREELGGAVQALGETHIVLEKDAVLKAAELLAKGAIGGWFRGKSEMGPRALGHRSILADPRSKGVRDRLNRAIKQRESFQPFAPAVLIDRCRDLFPGVVSSPYMLQTFLLPEETRALIPAVIHEDGTSRIQTVTPGDGSGLDELLLEFEALTGLPVLLNTSLNGKGEPLANSPKDAAAIFERCGLDFLVLEDILVMRRNSCGP